ncbi:helix-turn-helix domain-containing protein [Goodfellowiella coeruleoviolacea]|uniref:Helix-turn-helix domain-containing protein n=1 Tax=Goodfellowiella coeruleoviolacea TaxID=334858 RepID=A0AAE3GJ30_9PSEU|nr:helix-turn-helix transcriptional regulator [Goodfellowiella coeruleoviolacea]MCP2169090.1 Helix-turn-helix domain-containing protein [Goodfellowiella coeruleoviolacea]
MSTQTVRLKFLGIAMREFREQTDVTPQQAAKTLGRAVSKITRLEKGQNGLTVAEAEKLLRLYQVTDEAQVAEVLDLARTSRRRGHWAGHRSTIPLGLRPYIEFEQDASRHRSYGMELVPGLLQTPNYTRVMLLRPGPAKVAPEDIDRVVQTRIDRQQTLFGDSPAEAHFVLSESCLRRHYGTNRVMHEQMLHLAEMALRPNIVIQILPFRVPGTTFGFKIMRIPAPAPSQRDPLDLVYVETLHNSDYLDDMPSVQDYDSLWSYLSAAALGPEDSRRMILSAAQEYE